MKMEQNFREAFKDFERNPSDKVWSNIEKNIKTDFAVKKSLFKSAKFWVVNGVVFSFVAIILVVFLNNKQQNSDIKPQDLVSDVKTENQSDNKIIERQEMNSASQLAKSENLIKSDEKYSTVSEQNLIHNQTFNSSAVIALKEEQINNDVRPELKPALPTATPQANNTKAIENNESKGLNTLPPNNTFVSKTSIINISFSENQKICKGDKVKLYVNGGVSYLWSTGERSQSIFVSPEETTDYSVIATDEDGNKKTGLISVEVANCQTLFVPNAFTPNGDGRHDEFRAVGNGIRKFEMVVLSRDGKLVFTSNDMDKGWDGSFNGNPVEMGTYVYSIKYIDELNKPHTINGHVNVIR